MRIVGMANGNVLIWNHGLAFQLFFFISKPKEIFKNNLIIIHATCASRVKVKSWCY
jgi:hypothetical protein